MTDITIAVKGAQACLIDKKGILTSGMVGARVNFQFDSNWDGLQKTAVFRAGGVTRDVLGVDTVAAIPPEVLEKPGKLLYVGVYGVNEAGDLVIPTAWATAGSIFDGADPSGDESTDPSLPVWAQLQAKIGKMADLETTSKENLVAAINEVLNRARTEKTQIEKTIMDVLIALNLAPVILDHNGAILADGNGTLLLNM